MSFFSWLRNGNDSAAVKRPGGHRPARKPAAFRPRLEALEGRDVPSTLTVLNNLDSGKGSLRDAIVHANKNDTIVFAPNLDGQTITLTSGELQIKQNLTINGPGASQLTVSGNHASRVFEVAAKEQLTLSGLAIRDGDGVFAAGTSHANDGEGGAVLNQGTLAINNCIVSSSSALGGGIANLGALTVSGCTLTGNSADDGGGIYIYNGTVTVSGCTLSDNSATTYGGAIYNHAGALTVSGSVFCQNTGYNNMLDNIAGPWTDGGGNTFC